MIRSDITFNINTKRSLVRPVLELYSNAVWAPCLLKNITGIENVQRHFIKCIIYWHEPPGV